MYVPISLSWSPILQCRDSRCPYESPRRSAWS
jgi:hypothetical protein